MGRGSGAESHSKPSWASRNSGPLITAAGAIVAAVIFGIFSIVAPIFSQHNRALEQDEVRDWLSRNPDACTDAPHLLLNEVCSEGPECHGGKDFVEIINPPGNDPAPLGCYALRDMRSTREGTRILSSETLLPAGHDLGAGEIQAWDEDELGFKLGWEKGDRLELLRVKLVPDGRIDFIPLDHVVIDPNGSYHTRFPGELGRGLLWPMTHEEVMSAGRVGSFGTANSYPMPELDY